MDSLPFWPRPSKLYPAQIPGWPLAARRRPDPNIERVTRPLLEHLDAEHRLHVPEPLELGQVICEVEAPREQADDVANLVMKPGAFGVPGRMASHRVHEIASSVSSRWGQRRRIETESMYVQCRFTEEVPGG